MAKKSSKKRGHPVSIAIYFDQMKVIIYYIYSEQSKQYKVLKLGRKFQNANPQQLYSFFENLLNELRPLIKQGYRSMLLIREKNNPYPLKFIEHLKKHHKWLFKDDSNRSVIFKEIEGNARDLSSLENLRNSETFLEALGVTLEKEGENILSILEQRLNDNESGLVLYKLKEIEDLVFAGGTKKKKFKPLKLIPEYIIFTDEYIDKNPQKSRIQRLIQIAKNREIRTKIIDAESSIGERLSSMGGVVCFLKTNSNYEKEIGNKIIENN